MSYLENETLKREKQIEAFTQSFGKKMFSVVRNESQSIFKAFYWKQFPMRWFGRNETLRVQLLKFVSGYPIIISPEGKFEHFKKCFIDELESAPWLFLFASLAGKLPLGRKIIVSVMDRAIKLVARHFIVEDSKEEVSRAIGRLKKEGASCNLDVLGEEVLSEEAADEYLEKYLSLLKIVNTEVSLKPSGLKNSEYRLREIFKAASAGATVDIEQYFSRDFTFETFKRVLDEEKFQHFDKAGIAFQVYLRDWKDSLKNLVLWAKERNHEIKIRLVKGAYWDFEVSSARKDGREIPVFTEKWQTDLAFEEACELLMADKAIRENIRIAVASHNVRSVAKAMALAEVYGFPKERMEFQVLYGMGYPLMKAIIKMGYSVKVYVATGDMAAGIAFLVRRIIENTSQTSFVFQSLDSKIPIEELLKNPKDYLKP